jgi:acyl phosphate:glycerol-3-phosphate acyltransferase
MPGPEFLLPMILTAVAAYLIGSVSFSIIFTAIFARQDVRKSGSGNAGTTNVLRTAGKLPAALTFLFDFLKCVAAICLGLFIFQSFVGLHSGSILSNLFGNSETKVVFIKFVAGLFCMLGHIYPLYFGFRGGKGVVTTSALVLMISWQVYIIAMGLFIIIFAIKRIVSLSVLCAAVTLPFATFIITWMTKGGYEYVIANTLLAVCMTAILFITHRANIKRLLSGTEAKLTKS